MMMIYFWDEGGRENVGFWGDEKSRASLVATLTKLIGSTDL